MENIYLIDEIYEFIPEKLILRNVHTQKSVNMYSTASLCLLLLVKKHCQVVSQKELLAFGWGNKNASVSYNALYQCILNLRKNFTDIGCNKIIITTLPRKGLSITDEVSISMSDNVSQQALPSLAPVVATEDTLSGFKHFIFHIALLLSSLSIALLLVLIFQCKVSEPFDFREMYHPLPNKNPGCTYYINDDYNNEIKYEDVILQTKELCRNKRYIFITALEGIKSHTLIYCNKFIGQNKKNKCTSIYYP